MKKRDNKIISCRPKGENKWLFKALEQRMKKEKRASISNTVESILIDELKKD